jgi:hypothetical protein
MKAKVGEALCPAFAFSFCFFAWMVAVAVEIV